MRHGRDRRARLPSEPHRGVESVVRRLGFSLITVNTDDQVQREREALSFFCSRRIDGILVVIAHGRHDNSHIERTLKTRIPGRLSRPRSEAPRGG